jgi:hypothetical protein
MSHLILLGDSIFDNAAYTNGGPDVVTQLNEVLPAGWTASLLAVDGSTTGDVAGQVGCLPSDASHLVLSVGGNDALQQAHVLLTPASSTDEALGLLAELAEQFERDYRAAVQACLRPGLPFTACTIYNGNFPDPAYQRLVTTALALFNDAILRVAIAHRLPVIDLRAICTDPEDYANPIEPSSVGGQKIARVIATLTMGVNFADGATRIIAA